MTSTAPQRTVLAVLIGLSVSHLLNDMLQALLPSLYPLLKATYALSFWQIGTITLTNQTTSSLLQPLVGFYTDRHPKAYSLATGMTFTLTGLILLSRASTFITILLAAATVGVGSAIFHPESSRLARIASGGKHGLAQSLFQTGGNFGTSLGPLLAAFVVLPRGQYSLAWFSVVALIAIVLLGRIGAWYQSIGMPKPLVRTRDEVAAPTRAHVRGALFILFTLVFSKYVYQTSFTSYYMFFLIQKFHLSMRDAQLHLFAFLGAVAAGTFMGGPIGDRIGRKPVIIASIAGVLPFTLVLPYMDLFWTTVLSIIIGLVLSSAFSAILVFAQELVPHRVGLISGVFFGFAFGVGGIGAAALGILADHTSITFVYHVCAFLPALGLLAFWLPNLRPHYNA